MTTTLSKNTTINGSNDNSTYINYYNNNTSDTVTFPITVNGGTESNPITITFNGYIIDENTYFTIESDYVTINNTNTNNNNYITAQIKNYPGLVQTGQNTSTFTNMFIKNININDNNTNSTLKQGAGWICGSYNYASVDNCTSNSQIGIPGNNGGSNSGNQYSVYAGENGPTGFGGIAGKYNYGAITNCTTYGDIKCYGGNGIQFTNSASESDETDIYSWGGNGGSGGGIVGTDNRGTITNCTTYGNLYCYGGNGAAGIDGLSNGISIPNGYIGSYGGKGGSGGLITDDYNYGIITNCVSWGYVTNCGGKGGNGGNGANVNETGNVNGGYGGWSNYGGNGGSGGGIVGNYNSNTVQYCSSNGAINNYGGNSGNGGNGGTPTSGGEGGNGGSGNTGGHGGSGGGIAGDYNKGNISICYTNISINTNGGNGGNGGTAGSSVDQNDEGGLTPEPPQHTAQNGYQGIAGYGGSGGSIVGDNNSGYISYCYSNSTINSSGGYNGSGIDNSNGQIAGPGIGGGLIGTNNIGTIQYCYFNGTLNIQYGIQHGDNEPPQNQPFTCGYIGGCNNSGPSIGNLYSSSVTSTDYYPYFNTNSGTNNNYSKSWSTSTASATLAPSWITGSTNWITTTTPFTLISYSSS